MKFVGAASVAHLMNVDADAELFETILQIIVNQTEETNSSTVDVNDGLDILNWLTELATIRKFDLIIKFVAAPIREAIVRTIQAANIVDESLLTKYSK